MNARQVQANARAVLLAAFRRYGLKSFPVNPDGPNWQPLKAAERMGWTWFNGERCAITAAGELEAAEYVQPERPSSVSWECAVCGHLVRQPDGDTGLPEDVPCPNCRRTAMQAADRMTTDSLEGRAP